MSEKIVGLSDTGNKKAKKFSLGMRQRLGIAIALAANLISNVQASFMLCAAFMLSHVCVGTPLLGWFVSKKCKESC